MVVAHRWSQGRTVGYQARTEKRFARMLLVVMPCSLFLTYVWKQSEAYSHTLQLTHATIDAPGAELYGGTLYRTEYYRPPPTEPRCRQSEQLLRLSAPLGFSQWENQSALPDDCCSWEGVSCNPGGFVQKLELRGLSGTLPAALGQLHALRVLDCNKQSALSGTLPTQA